MESAKNEKSAKNVIKFCECKEQPLTDQQKKEDMKYFTYVFPAIESFANISIDFLPFTTKNKIIKRYGKYILSPIIEKNERQEIK